VSSPSKNVPLFCLQKDPSQKVAVNESDAKRISPGFSDMKYVVCRSII